MGKPFQVALLGVLCSAALLFTGVSRATTTVLDFEGVGDQCSVNDFYNGGTDACGHSGTNYGIGFTSASLGLIDEDAGGTGNFANEPSPSTVLFFLDANQATMNVEAGFDTGFSFYYSSSTVAFVNVWSGLDATGELLATLNLALNGRDDNCTGDPTGYFCHWDPIGVTFDGIAHSVDFGGTANQTGFDNITLGSDTPGGNVPEPGVLGMFGLGLLLLAGAAWKRRRLTS